MASAVDPLLFRPNPQAVKGTFGLSAVRAKSRAWLSSYDSLSARVHLTPPMRHPKQILLPGTAMPSYPLRRFPENGLRFSLILRGLELGLLMLAIVFLAAASPAPRLHRPESPAGTPAPPLPATLAAPLGQGSRHRPAAARPGSPPALSRSYGSLPAVALPGWWPPKRGNISAAPFLVARRFQVAYLLTPTGTETAPLARWWVVAVGNGGAGPARPLRAAPPWVPAAALQAPPAGWHSGQQAGPPNPRTRTAWRRLP